MAKPNYRHAKKQKEATRKARQDAKLQRRSHGPEASDAADAPAAGAPEADTPAEAVPAKPLA